MDVAASLEAVHRQGAAGCVKTSEDLERYRAVIKRTAPEVIVECGSFNLRSAMWFARVGHCPVITIDINPYPVEDELAMIQAEGVTILVGNTVNPSMVEEVHRLVGGRAAFVSLDSDHSAEHVYKEMQAYSSLVPVGGYMVVEDGIVRWMPDQPYNGSPLDAIERWLPERPEWVIDSEIEDLYPVTMFPNGWLRRESQ